MSHIRYKVSRMQEKEIAPDKVNIIIQDSMFIAERKGEDNVYFLADYDHINEEIGIITIYDRGNWKSLSSVNSSVIKANSLLKNRELTIETIYNDDTSIVLRINNIRDHSFYASYSIHSISQIKDLKTYNLKKCYEKDCDKLSDP